MSQTEFALLKHGAFCSIFIVKSPNNLFLLEKTPLFYSLKTLFLPQFPITDTSFKH